MDSNVLSAENYFGEIFEKSGPAGERKGRNQFRGSVMSQQTSSSKTARNVPGSTNTSRAAKKEKSQSTSPDGSGGMRQRGRPRLNTKDQTAAEVHS